MRKEELEAIKRKIEAECQVIIGEEAADYMDSDGCLDEDGTEYIADLMVQYKELLDEIQSQIIDGGSKRFDLSRRLIIKLPKSLTKFKHLEEINLFGTSLDSSIKIDENDFF